MSYNININTIEYLMDSHVPWKPHKMVLNAVDVSADNLISAEDICDKKCSVAQIELQKQISKMLVA